MTGNKGVKRSTRNEIPKSPTASAIGKQGGGPGAVVDRDCSAEVDMSIQALVEGAVSGALKGVKTGDGLKGAKPRTTGEMDVGRIIYL